MPLGETWPSRVINAVMTVDAPGRELRGGPPPRAGVWALSQRGFPEVSHGASEVTLCNSHLRTGHLSLPRCSSAKPGTQHVLREIVLSELAEWQSGLGSMPSVQGLGAQTLRDHQPLGLSGAFRLAHLPADAGD